MATLDVGLLVNNVGLSYDHCEYYEQLSEQSVRDIVEVNITSVNQVCNRKERIQTAAIWCTTCTHQSAYIYICFTTGIWLQMTQIALPAMKANRRGIILNVGSGSGSLVPASPLTSVYAGTKVRHSYFLSLQRWRGLLSTQNSMTIAGSACCFLAWNSHHNMKSATQSRPVSQYWRQRISMLALHAGLCGSLHQVHGSRGG